MQQSRLLSEPVKLLLAFIGASTLLLSMPLAGQELAMAQAEVADSGKKFEEDTGQQEGDAEQQCEDIPEPPTPITISVSLSMDGGRDRLAIVDVRRGSWQFRSFNRVSPDGQFAFSSLLVGRKVSVSRSIDGAVLLGPWRTHENGSWDQLVLATNVTLRRDRFQAALLNYWAFPTAGSGYFFEVHTQTLNGLPYMPRWVSVNLVQKHSKFGFERLFVGPLFTGSKGAITFSACPYWDVQRERGDLRLGVTYTHTIRSR